MEIPAPFRMEVRSSTTILGRRNWGRFRFHSRPSMLQSWLPRYLMVPPMNRFLLAWPLWLLAIDFWRHAVSSWLVVDVYLWKIWVRQLGWWHSPIFLDNESHVPNHQPDYIWVNLHFLFFLQFSCVPVTTNQVFLISSACLWPPGILSPRLAASADIMGKNYRKISWSSVRKILELQQYLLYSWCNGCLSKSMICIMGFFRNKSADIITTR